MSAYRLNKLLYDMGRDPVLAEAFTAGDRAGIARRYKLSKAEAEALREADVPKLYRLGVHPLLLMHLALLLNIDLRKAYREGQGSRSSPN